jgi:predicted DNA-binding WGR domain protein
MDDRAIPLERLGEWKDIVLEAHDESIDPKTNKKKNTHKFYIFHVTEGSSHFEIEYGRIGKKPSRLQYPISELKTKYREKINKGYKVVRSARHDEQSIFFVDLAEKIMEGEDEWLLPD